MLCMCGGHLVQIGDGDQLVDLRHDLEVATGDAVDIEVVDAHARGSYGIWCSTTAGLLPPPSASPSTDLPVDCMLAPIFIVI